MGAYYNEYDPFAAAWLRELIKAGELPAGDVDERSIVEVKPEEIRAYTQVHLFAGIGGWPYALRLAGWPDNRPIWTGSCPCQPFSVAGARAGVADERHLWPYFWELVAECKPPTCIGEQVASTDGLLWLAGVRDDLESCGYAVGAADLPAAGVGAPHIRQRLYWGAVRLGNADNDDGQAFGTIPAWARTDAERGRDPGGLADSGRGSERSGIGPGTDVRAEDDRGLEGLQPGGTSAADRMADANIRGCEKPGQSKPGEAPDQTTERISAASRVGNSGSGRGTAGIPEQGSGKEGESEIVIDAGSRKPGRFDSWSDYRIVSCGDQKARRIGAGIQPLVTRLPGRVGHLRGYGNAIVPPLAAEFVAAVMDVIDDGI